MEAPQGAGTQWMWQTEMEEGEEMGEGEDKGEGEDEATEHLPPPSPSGADSLTQEAALPGFGSLTPQNGSRKGQRSHHLNPNLEEDSRWGWREKGSFWRGRTSAAGSGRWRGTACPWGCVECTGVAWGSWTAERALRAPPGEMVGGVAAVAGGHEPGGSPCDLEFLSVMLQVTMRDATLMDEASST